MKQSSIIIALILFCVNVHAEIYTCKDADGKTIYTDSPAGCTNAETIKTDELPTLIPTKPLANTSRSTSSTSTTSQAEDKDKYTALTITSPTNGSTVRDNQGNITINFQVSPALQTREGHKYVVNVSGKEVYSGTSTITALKNVDRGTHTVAVKVVDANGSTKISAAPVTFTLQRFSALQNVEGTNSGNDGGDNNGGDNSGNAVNNQQFPSNTKFNRPASPPPTSN